MLSLSLPGGRIILCLSIVLHSEFRVYTFYKFFEYLFCELSKALSEREKRRFLLYYEYEYNYYEIAAMEHCTASSVGQSIARAKEKIEAQMKKYLCA